LSEWSHKLSNISRQPRDDSFNGIFQDNPGKPVPECSILIFIGAKDDGAGGDKWMC